jgi:hypothetical protein
LIQINRALLVSVALLQTCTTGTAVAANYDVHACQLPNGSAAPANGWTPTTVGGPEAVLSIGCPGGAMTGRTGSGTHADQQLIGFSFVAPPGTTISGYERTAEGDVTMVSASPGSWTWVFGEAGTLVGHDEVVDLYTACDNCGPFLSSADIPPGAFGYRISRLVTGLQCIGRGARCESTGAHFDVRRISVHLEDLMPPQILAASGSLSDQTKPLRGEATLTLRLRDVGGGLYKTRIEADGQRVSERLIDDPRGTCRPPFVAPVPCPSSASVDLPIDTTRWSEGEHAITVRVIDATGVNATTYGPIRVLVDNVPEVVPASAQRFSCPPTPQMKVVRRLRKPVVPFGGINWVTGRVRGPRSELRGSRVALIDGSGTRTAGARAAGVGQRGRFKLRIRSRVPGEVRPIVLSSSGQPRACGRSLKLKVRAGVQFAVAPRRLRNGQSIVMRGRIRSKVPPHGKKVAIQARARGATAWTTVTVLRSNRAGRFRFRYRFRRTFVRTTYEFRAVAPRERGHPYLRGWSPTRRAVVWR